ncbi:MAG: hypothetical protein DRG30_05640 [Epsilonproteobacteria bacterium]|nr:MAG: hypothetical protein DRG30_05640 [Campylobacterota bacterium]
MGKVDKIKEQIGWLKVVFGILSAIAISLVGFLATNYQKSEPIISILAMSFVLMLSFAIIIVNKKAFNKIDELEEL